MYIRKSKQRDLSAVMHIARLHRDVIGLADKKARFEEHIGTDRVIVACNENDKPIGFVYAYMRGKGHHLYSSGRDHLYVSAVAVHPDYQRQGTATAMLNELVRSNSHRNIKANISSNNEAATALYRKCGFDSDTSYVFTKSSQPLENIDKTAAYHIHPFIVESDGSGVTVLPDGSAFFTGTVNNEKGREKKSTINPEDITYDSDSTGYMMYYKGKPIGGAGSLPSDKKKHWRNVSKDVSMYGGMAETMRQNILNDNMGRGMREAIEEIDAELGLDTKNSSVKTAGQWSLPDTPEKIEELDSYLNSIKTEKFGISKHPEEVLYDILGSDNFFDIIDDLENKKELDADTVIISVVSEIERLVDLYKRDPKSFKRPIDVKELENIARKYANISRNKEEMIWCPTCKKEYKSSDIPMTRDRDISNQPDPYKACPECGAELIRKSSKKVSVNDYGKDLIRDFFLFLSQKGINTMEDPNAEEVVEEFVRKSSSLVSKGSIDKNAEWTKEEWDQLEGIVPQQKKPFVNKLWEKMKEYGKEIAGDFDKEAFIQAFMTRSAIDETQGDILKRLMKKKESISKTSDNGVGDTPGILNTVPAKSYDIDRIDGTEDSINPDKPIPKNVAEVEKYQYFVSDFVPVEDKDVESDPPVDGSPDVMERTSEEPGSDIETQERLDKARETEKSEVVDEYKQGANITISNRRKKKAMDNKIRKGGRIQTEDIDFISGTDKQYNVSGTKAFNKDSVEGKTDEQK